MGWLPGQYSAQAKMVSEVAVMPKDLRLAAATLKGHAPVPDSDVVQVPAHNVFPVVEIRESTLQTFEAPQIGQKAGSKGIFLGQWQLTGTAGESPNLTLNVYASPQDLVDESGNRMLLTFKQAAEEVGKLWNWHGHDGGYFENDIALNKAIRDGRGIGKWFIPPSVLLDGKEPYVTHDGRRWPNMRPNQNIYDLKNFGDFEGTLMLNPNGKRADAYYDVDACSYWSCTTGTGYDKDMVYQVYFPKSEYVNWKYDSVVRCNSRLCRVELAL